MVQSQLDGARLKAGGLPFLGVWPSRDSDLSSLKTKNNG